MRIARMNNGRGRRAVMAALTGTTALAIVGGSVLSASAATSSTYSCLATNGSTQLVDFASTGTGLINHGSSGGLVGVATDANGVQIGLLSCTAVVGLGGTVPGTAVLVGVPTSSGTPTVPNAGAPSVPTSAPDTTTPSTPTTPTTAPESPGRTKLSTVEVSTSTSTVYPAAKGYSRSRVTFSIKGLTSANDAVAITGKAVLRKGTKVIKTWRITSTTSELTWNGRIGRTVRAGVYTLTVTAVSPDGTKKVSTMKVRVSPKHLVTRSVSVRSKDIASASRAKLPAEVAKAFAVGRVTVRIRTVAEVTGAAKLVFSNGSAERSLVLRDGAHTTRAIIVPKGFGTVTIGHRWKKGAAKLVSLRTVFTYKQLV